MKRNQAMTTHDRASEAHSSFLSFTLLIAGSFVLAVGPWFYGLVLVRDQLITQTLVTAIFLIAILVWNSGWNFRGLDNWMAGTFLLGIFYFLFSAIRYTSLLAFLKFANVIFFYFVMRGAIQTRWTFRAMLWLGVFLTSAYAVYGLLQFYGYIPHVYWYKPTNLSSRYVNGGHFALFLVFGIFSALALLSLLKSSWIKIFVFPWLFPLCWALLLTRSRTVWGAFLIGFLVYAFLMQSTGSLRNRMISLVFTGLAVFSGGTVLAKFGVFDSVWQRIESVWNTGFFSLFHRWQFWEGSMNALTARPFGWGIGTFSSVFPQFRIHSDRFFVDYAHNEFLQLAVDFGIPGLIFFLAFILYYFKRGLTAVADPNRHPLSRKMIAIWFALMFSLFVASQADFGLRIYATSLMFAAYLAAGEYLFAAQPAASGASGLPILKAACFIFVLICGFLTSRQLYAQIHFERGVQLEKDFSWEKAREEYEKAAAFSPITYQYFETLGTFYRKRSGLASNKGTKTLFRQKAIQAFERGARLQPYSAPVHYALAMSYDESGNPEQSRKNFKDAVRLYPQNAVYVLEFAYFSLKNGNVPEAIDLFERFQQIRFRELSRDSPCQILTEVAKYTKNYHDLVRVVSSTWEDHQCLAKIMGESGEWDKATTEFKSAAKKLQEQSGYKAYMISLGENTADFYSAHGKLEKALAIYQEALHKLPEQTSYQEKIRQISEKMHPPAPANVVQP